MGRLHWRVFAVGQPPARCDYRSQPKLTDAQLGSSRRYERASPGALWSGP